MLLEQDQSAVGDGDGQLYTVVVDRFQKKFRKRFSLRDRTGSEYRVLDGAGGRSRALKIFVDEQERDAVASQRASDSQPGAIVPIYQQDFDWAVGIQVRSVPPGLVCPAGERRANAWFYTRPGQSTQIHVRGSTSVLQVVNLFEAFRV